MAKYMGDAMTLTIGGTAITCLQSVNTSESIDTAVVACSAGTFKEPLTGQREASMTVVTALETDDVTQLGLYDPGDSGAIVFKPAGATAGDISISATTGRVSARTMPLSVNGFGTASFTILLDSFTIAANT